MRDGRILAGMVCAFLAVTISQSFGLREFKDGYTHDIDYTINDEIWIDYLTPGINTTVVLLNGGVISYPCHLRGFNDSEIILTGGKVSYLDAYNNCTASLVDSNSKTKELRAYDEAIILINGGKTSSLYAYGNCKIEINQGGSSNVYAADHSKIALRGGAIDGYLNLQNNAQLTMGGGRVNCLHMQDYSIVVMSGGDVYHHSLRIDDNSILVLDGFDFMIDGTPFTSGEVTSILKKSYSEDPYRWLIGTLASGETINYQFQIGNNGKIVLIPEPATLALMFFGGIVITKSGKLRSKGRSI